MCPAAQADGHDDPWLLYEAVPGGTAMIEDFLIGRKHPVREPVVAQALPHILHRVQLRRAGRQDQKGDVGRHLQLGRDMPAWSTSSTACAPSATFWLTSANCAAMAFVSQ